MWILKQSLCIEQHLQLQMKIQIKVIPYPLNNQLNDNIYSRGKLYPATAIPINKKTKSSNVEPITP